MTRIAKKEHIHAVAQMAFLKKGHDVVLMDLRKVTSMTDFFILVTADSDTQVRAVADAMIDELHREGEKPWRSEGWEGMQWIILDFVDYVVHVFQREARAYYNLERLWGDAQIEKVIDKAALPKKVKKAPVKKVAAKKTPAKNTSAKKKKVTPKKK